MIDLFVICFVCACVGWSYVERLTANRQIFDFVQAWYDYLPKELSELLRCSYCVSGWLSVATVFIYWHAYLPFTLSYLIIAPCITFVFVHFIKK